MNSLLECTILASLLATNAFSADPAGKKLWRDVPEASVVSMTGNTQSTSISLRNLFVIEQIPWRLGVALGGLGARSGRQVTGEQYYANEKLDRGLSAKTYLYEKIGWSKDRFAGVRARDEAYGGAGYHFFDKKVLKLFGEVGTGYVIEDRYDEAHDDYPAMRGFLKFIYDFSVWASFSQGIEYFVNVTNGNDFRTQSDTALTTKITDRLSVKTSFGWAHVNRPPIGRVADDTTTNVALVGSF